MATIKWLDASAEGFGGELVLDINDRRTKAVYELGGGAEIVLTGSNLKAQGGVLQSGTVGTATFVNNAGNPILTVDGTFKASKLGEVGRPAIHRICCVRCCRETTKLSDLQTVSSWSA